MVFLLLFILLTSLSLLNSPVLLFSSLYIFSTLFVFVMVFSFNVLMPDKAIQKSLAQYSIIAVVIFAFYVYIITGANVRSLGVQPGAIGMASISTIMGALYIRRFSLKTVVIAFPLVILYLANSRATILGLIVGLFVLTAGKRKNLFRAMSGKNGFITVAVFFTCIAFSVPLMFIYKEELWNLFVSIFALDDPHRGLGTGATNRNVLWAEAWELFKSHPWVGVGYRAHATMIIEGSSAHNGYLAYLAETGVVGFSVLIYFMTCSVVNHIKRIHEPFILWSLSFIIMYFVIGVFESFLLNFGNPLSIIAILLLVRGFLMHDHRKERITS